MMPVNEWTQILPVVLSFSVPPMRSDCANPVQFCVSSACKRSISLSIELLLKGFDSGRLPALVVFYFHDKGSSRGEGGHRQLRNLDDEVRNVDFWVVLNSTLWSDYVPLRRREE